MKEEYIKLISEHDKLLSTLRKNWTEAKGVDKTNWMNKINSSLDERIRLMGLRDEL